MNKRLFIYLVLCCSVILLLVLLPRILSGSHIILANEILYYSLFAVSFNLLFGYGGMLSFGHGGLFGLGAYACGLILTRITGIPILLSIFWGGFIAMIGGAIIGFFSLRLRGTYFALLTLAFQMFLFTLALKWRNFTGGEDGLVVRRPDIHLPLLGTLSLTNGRDFYFFSLIIVVIALLICFWLLQTSFGNSIRCIKDNEERATFLGYKTFSSRFILFCISSFMAGIAGSLFTLRSEFVSLEAINIDTSFAAIMMTFIGGAGYFLGPVLGSAFYVIFQDWLSSLTDRWLLVMGALFIIMVLYLDRGLVSIFWRRRR